MKCPNDGSTLITRPNRILHCPICPFNVPENTKILETLYAWVSVDKDGMEGFFAAEVRPGVMMALSHSELHKALELEDLARRSIASVPGYHARLIKFSKREIIRD